MKISTPKILLTFAHRGEAQEFLEKKRFQVLDFSVNGFYDSTDEFLLLTGEGIACTKERLSAVCGEFRHQIAEVINLGIAGGLSEEISIGEIYRIGAVLREPAGGQSFGTYRSAETSAAVDCITAGKRVLDEEYALRLAGFAKVVDRELWGIAAVCAQLQLPFRSCKLISDRAGENTETQEIKRRAPEYSARLYQFYCDLQPTPQKNHFR
jgi:nucleoside phosphorylase